MHQFCMPYHPVLRSPTSSEPPNPAAGVPSHFPPKPGRSKRSSTGFWKAPCFSRQHLGLLQNNPPLAEAIDLLKILLPFTDHAGSDLTFLTQSNWSCTNFYKQR